MSTTTTDRAARADQIARIARAEIKNDARKDALASMTSMVERDFVLSYEEIQAIVAADARRRVWMTLVNAIEIFAADGRGDAVDAYEAVTSTFERSLRVRPSRSTSAMSDLMDDAFTDAKIKFLDDYRLWGPRS